MNSTFVFVLLIIAIVMTANVIQTYLKREKKPSQDDIDADEMITTIDALEKRIRVLERIVTEKHVDLRHEIDSL